MTRVMIVEDDYIVRLYLKNNIKWEDEGFEVVAEASNGKEALEKLHESAVDIILTDISMPEMDGITLIKRLRELYPEIKVVVLSCHNDFFYVKDAMKLGAYDYLLKHAIEPKNLLDVIKNVRKAASAEKRSREELANLKISENSDNASVQAFFIELLKGMHNIGIEKIECKLKKLGVDIGRNNFVVINIEVLDRGIFREIVSVEDPELYKFSVLNVIDEILADVDRSIGICYDSERFVAIVGFEEYKSLLGIENQQQSIIRKIQECLLKTLKVKVFISVSNMVKDLTQLSTAFEQALDASRYKIYKMNVKNIFYKEIKRDYSLSEIYSKIAEFKTKLRNNSFEECEAVLEAIFGEIQQLMISPEDLELVFIELLNSLSSYLDNLGLEKSSILGLEIMPYNSIRKFDNIKDLFGWYTDVYERVKKSVSNHLSRGYRKEIRNAMDYMEKNLSREITLNEVAEYAGISPVYFSQLFKQQTGENFSEYLNKIRINKAKRLLEETNLKIYEVAYSSGFNQPQYFIKIFKEMVGMTPLDYRKCSIN